MATQKTKPKSIPASANETAEAPSGMDPRDAWLLPLARKHPAIWRMLSQPVGAAIELTDEERRAIVAAGTGARPDLPEGTEYLKWVRKYWKGRMPSDRRPA